MTDAEPPCGALLHHETLAGQRVDDLVGEHYAAERRGQRSQPTPPDLRRDTAPDRTLAEQRTLSRHQRRARLEQQVLLERCAERSELGQHTRRKLPAARTELKQRTAAERAQHRIDRSGDRRGEQRRQFGCGDEIASLAELRAACGVVAEPRRIERVLHVLGEGDPSARCVDVRGDDLGEASRTRDVGRVGRRHPVRLRHLHDATL